LESTLTPKQQKRQQEREIIEEYHKMVTEEALEPLYQSFLEWKLLLLLAKMKLGRLSEKDIADNKRILERWGY
jgi:hypothetical protein